MKKNFQISYTWNSAPLMNEIIKNISKLSKEDKLMVLKELSDCSKKPDSEKPDQVDVQEVDEEWETVDELEESWCANGGGYELTVYLEKKGTNYRLSYDLDNYEPVIAVLSGKPKKKNFDGIWRKGLDYEEDDVLYDIAKFLGVKVTKKYTIDYI